MSCAIRPLIGRFVPPPDLAGNKESVMAGRVLNRRELRKQNDAATETLPAEQKVAPAKKVRAKKPASAAVRKPRKKKEPTRFRAHWGVFDAGMKRLALFDYNQRAEADLKVADLQAKKNGEFFVQMVKEPMPEPEPAEGPSA
jgi:hypothetical protein